MKNPSAYFFLFFILSCSSSKNKTEMEANQNERKEKINFTLLESYQFDSQLSQEGLAAAEERPKVLDLPGQMVAQCLDGKIEDGLEIARTYFKSLKNKAVFWNSRAICEELSGHHLLSDIAWRKALKIDPKFSPAYVNLGISMAKQGKMEKALAFFKKAQDVGRFATLPLYNMAILYLENGHAEKALNVLKGIESEKNNNEGVLGALGVASLVLGQVDQSLKYFEKMKSNKLEKPSWGLNYAFALYLQGDYAKAKKIIAVTHWEQDQASKQYYQELMFLLGKKI